jgi:hypothetical protein
MVPTAGIGRLWILALSPVVALAAVWLGWVFGQSQRLDVGTPADGAFVQGFFDREQFGGETYRWSKTDATAQLPVVGSPALLTIRMAGRPGGVPVTLEVGRRSFPTFQVTPLELRRYQVLLGPALHPWDLVTVVFGAQAERTDADGRRLAVLVESLAARPLATPVDAPPLSAMVSLPLLALAVGATLRLGGMSLREAVLASTLLGAGLAGAWTGWRLAVGPFLPAAATIAVAGAALLGSLRLALRGQAATAPALFGALAAAGGLWPLMRLLAGQALLDTALLVQALLVPFGLAVIASRGRMRTALGASILVLALLGTVFGQRAALVEADPGTPFHALHRAASRLWFGTLPLYNITALAANPFANTFDGPPAQALLALPLVGLPYSAALLAWRVVGVVLVLCAALLAGRALRVPLRSWTAAGFALLLLLFGPLWLALVEGQIAPLLLLLLAASLYLLVRGHDGLVGICLGVLLALAPPTLLLLVGALVRRRWRMLVGALAGVVAVGSVSIAVAGWPVHRVYLEQVAPALLLSTPWPQNQSINAVVQRLLAPDVLALRPAAPGVPLSVGWLAAGLVLLHAAWHTRRRRIPATWAFGSWLGALLLVAPVVWASEHTLLLLPLFLLLGAAARSNSQATSALPWPVLACVALGVALLAHGDPLALHDDVLRGAFWQLALSAQFFGAVLVYAGLVGASAGRAGA